MQDVTQKILLDGNPGKRGDVEVLPCKEGYHPAEPDFLRLEDAEALAEFLQELSEEMLGTAWVVEQVHVKECLQDVQPGLFVFVYQIVEELLLMQD